MTINQMIEDGIIIQGNIRVHKYDPKINWYEPIHVSVNGSELCGYSDEPWADREIRYIYAADDGFIVFEVD